jgi:uncharacterized protein DUF4397
MKKIILGTVAVLSSLIFLNSCTLDNNSTTQPQSGAFLLANASPTSPTLSVYFNSTAQIFDTLRFGDYTPYAGPVNPGTYDFIVDSFGTANPAKLKSTVTIEANKYYSYFIIDSFNKVKASFINDVFKVPSGDSAYIRFFNFCPNATSPLSLVNSADNHIWFDSRTFNDQSTNPQYIAFQEVPKGTYNFQLQNIAGDTLKTTPITLTGGYVYTLFAKGVIGSADTTRALSIGKLQNYPFH